MDSCLTRPFLILCGLCLIHMACGTTVIPLCEPGEADENCTTALVRKEGSPRVAKVKTVDCEADKRDYCFYGQCRYIVELQKPHCRCEKGYTGERCVHSELVTQPMSEEYVALTVILSVLFVVALAVGLYFLYKRYKNKLCKQQQPTKEYKEVTTCNV